MECRGGEQHDRRALHERHQRHGREVEHETSQRGLAERVGGHRSDRALGGDRRAGEERRLAGKPGRRPRQARRQSRREPPRAPLRVRHDRERGEDGQPEADVDHGQRRHHDDQRDRDGDGVDGRRAQVERARREVDRGGQRRARDRGAADDGGGIERQHAEHDHGARPRRQADAADESEHDRGEHGDVAARDREHVIGAGPPHPRLDLGRQAGPVADEDRQDDRRPLGIVRPDRRRHGPPRPCPRRGRGFGERRSPRQHLDQRRALHRTEHADAPPRQPHFLIRRAEVAVRQGAPQRGRDPGEAAGAPRVPRRRGVETGNGQAHAAGDRRPAADAPDAPHVERTGDAEVRRHGVVTQHAFEHDRIVAGQRRQLRSEGGPRRVSAERDADGHAEQARHHRAPTSPVVPPDPRADRRGAGQRGEIRAERRVLRPEEDAGGGANQQAGRQEHRDRLREGRRRRGHADPRRKNRTAHPPARSPGTAVRAPQIRHRQSKPPWQIRQAAAVDASGGGPRQRGWFLPSANR
jgi:hypothetical protein